jgi:hypothetical protein
VEPGAGKQEGLKQVPAVKPADSLASIFGAFGRRSAAEIARQEMEPFRPTLVPAVTLDESGDNCAVCTGPSAEELAKTYHVNLRLKRQRFVKLKLSAALLRRPVQDIVADALDDWFDKLPPDVLGDCACMKSRGD